MKRFQTLLLLEICKEKATSLGEFFYRLQLTTGHESWYYHVHTDKWTLTKLLSKYKILKMRL